MRGRHMDLVVRTSMTLVDGNGSLGGGYRDVKLDSNELGLSATIDLVEAVSVYSLRTLTDSS